MAYDAKKYFNKPGKTFPEQVQLLRNRGMHIEDHQLAIEHLSRIGYYRLSGYWEHLWREGEDGQKQEKFVSGASWDQVISLYDFDNRLKILLFEAIGAIEVAVRTQLIYHLYIKEGPYPHLKPQIFKPGRETMVEELHERGEEELRKPHPHEEFIKHLKDHYEGTDIPILMLTELLYLHDLAQFFDALKPEWQELVSKHFSVGVENLFNWLLCLNFVRNRCAHHSRLWNYELKGASRPKAPQKPFPKCRKNKVFRILCVVTRLIHATHFNEDDWRRRCSELLASVDSEQLEAMGVMDDWNSLFQPPA